MASAWDSSAAGKKYHADYKREIGKRVYPEHEPVKWGHCLVCKRYFNRIGMRRKRGVSGVIT